MQGADGKDYVELHKNYLEEMFGVGLTKKDITMNAEGMREYLLSKYNKIFSNPSGSAIQRAIEALFQRRKSQRIESDQCGPHICLVQKYRGAIDELLSSSGWSIRLNGDAL